MTTTVEIENVSNGKSSKRLKLNIKFKKYQEKIRTKIRINHEDHKPNPQNITKKYVVFNILRKYES